MLEFQLVKVKNFLSVGNNPVEVLLNKSPTTVIVGRNGSGKSLILDSINFCLYGKPYRKINKGNLVNSINNKNLEAEINFTTKGKSYRIIRGIKPNKFEIYEDGNLINQASDQRDYQEFLETNILGMNENAFKQIVLIGSSNYTPFMQLDTPKRREVIEDLLDIKIFTNMNILLKGKLSSVKETIRDLESKYELLSEKKKFFEDQQKKLQEDNTDKLKVYKDELESLDRDIKSLEESIDIDTQKISDLVSKLTDTHDKELEKIRKLKYTLSGRINAEEEKKEFFSKNDSCPSCMQSIEPSYKSDIIKDLDSTIEKYIQTDKKLQEDAEALKVLSKENEDLKLQINSLKNSVSISLNDKKNKSLMKNRIESEILKISKVSSNNDKEIEHIESEIDTIKDLLDSQLALKQRYDIVSKLLKDDGIKAKIIEQYIPQINYHVNEYLNQLGLPIQFTLDENFDEVIQSRYRDKFGYNCFSEGEKSRIDNSLLLTWREIAKSKNTTNTNLLFLDEVFDSSLDSNATEEFLNILSNYSGSNVFIVSHKADLTSKVRSVIEMEKHGNFTRIKPNTTKGTA